MQLLLTRLITAFVISATLFAQASLSYGQQDDSPLVVAVLDVQKVLDSMPDLQIELEALDRAEQEDLKAKERLAQVILEATDPAKKEQLQAGLRTNCRRTPKPTKATPLIAAYIRVREAAAEIADSQNINLVMHAQTTGLSNGDSLKFEQVDNANETNFVYQDSMNLTQAVIERLQQTDKNPLPERVKEDEKVKPVIAIIDVERVIRSVYKSKIYDFRDEDIATQEKKLKATLMRMRTAVSDFSKLHGIKAVLTGDTDAIFFNLNLDNVIKAISDPLVYHRHIDLTPIISRHLNNDAKEQESR